MTRSDFAAAYNHGFPSTVRFLLSTGVPADTADDVAQAGWARGWERRDQLRQSGKVVSWINRISLNIFRNRLRRQKITEELKDTPSRNRANEAMVDVHRGLAACAPEDRQLLKSYYVEGYTSRELGRREDCSAGAIRVRVLRARRRFIDAMKQSSHSS